MRCLLGTFSEPSCRLSLGNDQQGRPVIAAVKGVAKRSALRACDRIISVDGRPITRYEEALAAIRASGDDLQLVVLRDPQAPLLSSPLLSLRSSPLFSAPLLSSPLRSSPLLSAPLRSSLLLASAPLRSSRLPFLPSSPHPPRLANAHTPPHRQSSKPRHKPRHRRQRPRWPRRPRPRSRPR